MPLDLMHPSFTEERRRHKKKRLVQSPNSYFMDVKCMGCYRITTIFSHAQIVVPCAGCLLILSQPGGGKCRLTAGHRWTFPVWPLSSLQTLHEFQPDGNTDTLHLLDLHLLLVLHRSVLDHLHSSEWAGHSEAFSASSSFCSAVFSLSWARSNSSSTSWILRFRPATSFSA
uniref:40S ribosomal protein S27 n=1 Tax=Scophthalmus maximus TaxID=52904 RepID=A0A8D3ABJ2_SCOMX